MISTTLKKQPGILIPSAVLSITCLVIGVALALFTGIKGQKSAYRFLHTNINKNFTIWHTYLLLGCCATIMDIAALLILRCKRTSAITSLAHHESSSNETLSIAMDLSHLSPVSSIIEPSYTPRNSLSVVEELILEIEPEKTPNENIVFQQLFLTHGKLDQTFVVLDHLGFIELINLTKVNTVFRKIVGLYFLSEINFINRQIPIMGNSEESLVDFLTPTMKVTYQNAQRSTEAASKIFKFFITLHETYKKDVVESAKKKAMRCIGYSFLANFCLRSPAFSNYHTHEFRKAAHTKNANSLHALSVFGIEPSEDIVGLYVIDHASTCFNHFQDNFFSVLVKYKFSVEARELAAQKAAEQGIFTNLQLLLNSGPISDHVRGQIVYTITNPIFQRYTPSLRIQTLDLLLSSGPISDEERGHAFSNVAGTSKIALERLLRLDDSARILVASATSFTREIMNIIHAYASSIPKESREEAIINASRACHIDNLEKILDIHTVERKPASLNDVTIGNTRSLTILNSISSSSGLAIIESMIGNPKLYYLLSRIFNNSDPLSENERGSLIVNIAFLYRKDPLPDYTRTIFLYYFDLGIPNNSFESAIQLAVHSKELLELLLTTPLAEEMRGKLVIYSCQHDLNKDALDFLLNGRQQGCGSISDQDQISAIEELLFQGYIWPEKWPLILDCLKILLTKKALPLAERARLSKIAGEKKAPDHLLTFLTFFPNV